MADDHTGLQPAAGNPLRVLIAEDEAILAMAVEAMMEDWGYQVVASVACGADAIAKASALRPDILLLDVNLADEIDGVSAAKVIVKSQPAAVVFMTAVTTPIAIDDAERLRARTVYKPFRPVDLQRAIAEALSAC